MNSVDSPAKQRRAAPAVIRALRFRTAQVGLVFTAIVVLVALVGPYVAPYTPTEFPAPPYTKPSGDFIFGTDALGRDVLSRVLYGGRSILWMTVAASTLGMVVGVVIGLLAGYVKRLDNVLMRPTELIQAFPALILVLLFVSLLGPKTWILILLIGISSVPFIARLVRGLTVDLATRDFVAAAEIIGCTRRHILLREILPNMATPLLVQFGMMLSLGLTIFASLSFIGFGQQPPAVDWGLMVNENRSALSIQPWAVFAPTLMIAMFAIGATLLTEGLARTLSRVDREETPTLGAGKDAATATAAAELVA